MARVCSHLVLAPSYRLLLDQLLADIRSQLKPAPCTSQWIITPTSTLAGELRILLARESEAGLIAGVRIMPILPFIDRLSELLDQPLGPRWIPLFDILLYRLLEQKGEGELARLKELRGGQALLIPTFLDLADAGFDLDQQEILEEVMNLPETEPTTRAVLEFYLDWLRFLEQAQLSWAPLSCRQLSEKIDSASDSELSALLDETDIRKISVYIYGFYDFTDVAEQILASVARRFSTRFYLPFYRQGGKTHPAFDFVEPVIDSLRLRIGGALGQTEMRPFDDQTPLAFFLSTFPEGIIDQQPACITYQRASGLRAEVVAAAVQVRKWLDDPTFGLEPNHIHVVPPQARPYLDLVREIFPVFGIPLRLAGVVEELLPAQRAIRTIVRLWKDQAPAECLLSLLRDSPDLSCLTGVDLDHFESKLRFSGFDGQNWAGILEHAAEIGLTGTEVELIKEIIRLWIDPLSREDHLVLSADEAISRLQQIADRWLPEPDQVSSLIEALELLPADLKIPLSILLDLLERLAIQEAVDDPPEKAGVLFAPIMRTRGLAPRAFVFLGLASGRFPYPVLEDPLVAEPVRLKLGQLIRELGHRLRARTAVTEEMALLFMLANSSSEYVHWVIPDTDENGDSLAPTPWVQKYLQHWEVDEGKAKPNPVPRGPVEQARFLLSLAPDSGFLLPPGWAVYLDREYGTAAGYGEYADVLDTLARKDHEEYWNNVVPEAALGAGPSPTTIRVTELETLARCPFRCYSRLIARWTPLRLLDFTPDLQPTEWGSLLHKLFDTTIAGYRETGSSLRAMASDLLGDNCLPLIKRIDEAIEHAPLQVALLPPLFQKAVKARLLELAREYWKAVQTGDIPDGVNLSTEKRCNVESPEMNGVVISGQFDRMDDRGDHFVIIDYKSGREPDNLCQEIKLGFRLQPLLYPWLQEQSGEPVAKPVRFAYVFFGKTPVQEKRVSTDLGQSIDDWLRLFARILKKGLYLASSNEALEFLGVERAQPCQYCEYASLCRRFEREAPARMARFLTELHPDRLAMFETNP
ncbi:MAG TPA: PD-(D/E)XK nuclease family protein [Acidobacteriota bacterium]|nr:PD-(D/E)XK nuclease family protein [Acidobacteriota bacterium]